MPALPTTTIAPGVRQVTTGVGPGSHVYLLDDGDEIVAFDAAIRGSGPAILAAAGGALARVVLSHSHVDHRGAAAELGVPVLCHPDEVGDAEGDAGRRYIDFGRIANEAMRPIMERLTADWDGGPVTIAGTVEEGDEVAGFRVIHTPGHAPGQIALWRERDRLLLAGDSVYVIDLETGAEGPPRVPHPAVNWDTGLARRSIERLAGLDPAMVWTGHGAAVTEGAAAQLLRAAAGP